MEKPKYKIKINTQEAMAWLKVEAMELSYLDDDEKAINDARVMDMIADLIQQQEEDIVRKDKALVYAVRFLDPKNCNREFVQQALAGGKDE